MKKNLKLIIALIIVVLFFYIIFAISNLYVNANSSVCTTLQEGYSCPHQEQLNILSTATPIIASLALLAGALVFYLMSEKVEKKEKDLKKNTEVLLKFLSPDEKKLINLLIENNGKILQAELTRLPEMSKVKSHRTVLRLMDKGVIEKETLGKTNIIKFTKEIKEGLM